MIDRYLMPDPKTATLYLSLYFSLCTRQFQITRKKRNRSYNIYKRIKITQSDNFINVSRLWINSRVASKRHGGWIAREFSFHEKYDAPQRITALNRPLRFAHRRNSWWRIRQQLSPTPFSIESVNEHHTRSDTNFGTLRFAFVCERSVSGTRICLRYS